MTKLKDKFMLNKNNDIIVIYKEMIKIFNSYETLSEKQKQEILNKLSDKDKEIIKKIIKTIQENLDFE